MGDLGTVHCTYHHSLCRLPPGQRSHHHSPPSSARLDRHSHPRQTALHLAHPPALLLSHCGCSESIYPGLEQLWLIAGLE